MIKGEGISEVGDISEAAYPMGAVTRPMDSQRLEADSPSWHSPESLGLQHLQAQLFPDVAGHTLHGFPPPCEMIRPFRL